MNMLVPPLEYRKATPQDYRDTLVLRETRPADWYWDNVVEGWWNMPLAQAIAEGELPPTAAELANLDDLGASFRHLQEKVQGRTPTYATPEERLRAEVDASGIPYLTQEQWEASPHHRKDLPYEKFTTEERAAARAEVYDRNVMRRRRMAQYDAGVLGYIGAFGAQMLGSLPDPTNLIALNALRAAWAARAVTRIGRIGRTGVVGAAEGGLATAIQLPLVAAGRRNFGDEMTYGEALLDLAVGTALGGTISGIGRVTVDRAPTFRPDGTIDSSGVRPADERPGFSRVSAQRAADELDRIQQAGDDIRQGRPVDLVAAQVARERGDLSVGYDRVLRDPIGDPQEIIARISPGDINDILVQRGPAILREDGSIQWRGRALGRVTGFKKGHGLVKILWKHGERSAESEPLKVTKADIVALPNVVRDFEPVPHDTRRPGQKTWVIKQRGVSVVYGISRLDNQTDLLATVFRTVDPGLGESKQRSATTVDPDTHRSRKVPDTAAGPFLSDTREPRSSPTDKYIAPDQPPVNPSAGGDPALGARLPDGTIEISTALKEPEPSATVADPDVATFALAEQQGRITEAEARAMKDAREEEARLAKIDKAYDTATACTVRII
ncbi:MAG: hypothetical protein Kilf2KO_49110 [Rhodospirillales bacterium]